MVSSFYCTVYPQRENENALLHIEPFKRKACTQVACIVQNYAIMASENTSIVWLHHIVW